jgi:phosphatidylserine/phosphatidylglycerophosphate/cardiolipin synthase-like enzyme
VTHGIVQPEVRSAFVSLMNEWQAGHADLSPRELAWALRGASASDEAHRSKQKLEMVWSGPSGSSTFRRTDQALLELIQAANHSIIVVAFAAYKVPHIAEALVGAANRGVKILLILESIKESEGAVTFSALKAMGRNLARAATVYAWPKEKRGTDANGNCGALHVKCAVADHNAALISSANLTEYAMNLNMELGLLIQGGEVPYALVQHFRSLIQRQVLVDCSDQNL